MSVTLRCIPALVLVVSPAVLAAGDYVGVLRPTSKPAAIAIPEPGFYWPLAGPFGDGLGSIGMAEGFKMKLGYRYSPYFSVETGYADLGLASLGTPFATAPARNRGFSLETVGTVPLWAHATLYGKVGAWRSAGAAPLPSAVDAAPRQGSGIRYGLGLKYDLTRRLGLQAEMERYSPLDRWGSRESDNDQVTLGVTWRF